MVEVLKIAIYLLCLATSLACTYLLLRAYAATRAKMLLWSGLCFVFLALNSFIVVLDIVVFPEIDLQSLRHLASVGAVSVLLFGFVWDMD